MNIHALLRGFAAELAAAEVKPALGAVAVDGVDHGSDGRSLAVVIALILQKCDWPGRIALMRRVVRYPMAVHGLRQ